MYGVRTVSVFHCNRAEGLLDSKSMIRAVESVSTSINNGILLGKTLISTTITTLPAEFLTTKDLDQKFRKGIESVTDPLNNQKFRRICERYGAKSEARGSSCRFWDLLRKGLSYGDTNLSTNISIGTPSNKYR